MSLEQSVQGLTAAIVALHTFMEAQTGAASAPAADTPKKSTKAAAAPAAAPAPKKGKAKAAAVTRDDVKKLAIAITGNAEIEDGKAKVIAAIQQQGVDRLGDVSDELIPTLHALLLSVQDDGVDPREEAEAEAEEEDF